MLTKGIYNKMTYNQTKVIVDIFASDYMSISTWSNGVVEFALNTPSVDSSEYKKYIKEIRKKEKGLRNLRLWNIKIMLGDLSWIGKTVLTNNDGGIVWSGESKFKKRYILSVQWSAGFTGETYFDIDTGEKI